MKQKLSHNGSHLLVKRIVKRDMLYFFILLSALIIIFMLSLSIGKYFVSPIQIVSIFISKIISIPQTWSNEAETVIMNIRLPRVLGGTLVGMGLASAGAAYQGVFKNPMVSPDVLGASSGAGFGAALGILLSLSSIGISISAFVFSIIAVFLAYLVSLNVRDNPTLGMVLAGIMIGSIFSSMLSYLKLVSDPNNQLPAITYWLMGSLASIKMNEVMLAFFPLVSGLCMLLLLRYKINILTLGEEEATALGINTGLMRTLVVLSATIVTATCISISGMIGWIGLVVPHCARMLVGDDHKIMLPISMLLGACFLLVVDIFARMLTTMEIPIGILTSFIGAPFFLYLIVSRGRRRV